MQHASATVVTDGFVSATSSKAKVFNMPFVKVRSFQVSTWKMRRLVFVVAFIIQETKQRHTILENEPNLPDPSWPKFSTLRANPTQLDPSFDPECPTWPVNWINLRFIKKKFGLYNSNIYDLEGQNEMILLLIWWIGNKI